LPTFGSLPVFERLADRLDGYVLRAERLDGELWEFLVKAE